MHGLEEGLLRLSFRRPRCAVYQNLFLHCLRRDGCCFSRNEEGNIGVGYVVVANATITAVGLHSNAGNLLLASFAALKSRKFKKFMYFNPGRKYLLRNGKNRG